jgi:hypothetical protein
MEDAFSRTLLDLEDEGFRASQLATDELKFVLADPLRDEVSIAWLALLLRSAQCQEAGIRVQEIGFTNRTAPPVPLDGRLLISASPRTESNAVQAASRTGARTPARADWNDR